MIKRLTVLAFLLTLLPLTAVSAKENQNPRKFGQSPTSVLSVTETPKQGQIRSCEARQNGITNRMTSLNKMATNMLSKFDAILGRVENYYNTKVLPGKTVPNYATLKAEIATKKTAVQTALASAQTGNTSFSCTTGDAKEQLNRFQTDMKAVKAALKDYRTSIRNLIVAVHGVVEPKPTETE